MSPDFLQKKSKTKYMKILSVKDALNLVPNSAEYCFRGQAESGLSLLPSIHRTYGEKKLKRYQAVIFEQFLLYSLQLFKDKLPCRIDSTIEFLAMCQHHGLYTRMLDWSDEILVSLYFACKEKSDKDGELFILHKSTYDKLDLTRFSDITSKPHMVDMRPINPRMKVQSGCFVLWGNAPLLDESETYSLEQYNLDQNMAKSVEKYLIPAQSKPSILKELSEKYFINDDSIILRDKVSLKIEDAYNEFAKIATKMLEDTTNPNPSPTSSQFNLAGCDNLTGLPQDCPTDFSQYFAQTKLKIFPSIRSWERKIGRNENCDCGSGRKYKKCHGRN